MKLPSFLLALLSLVGIAQAQTPAPLQGQATYYHDKYVGRPMANGKPYRHYNLTVACWDLPLNSYVRVDYVSKSGKVRSVVCTVTDRGPARSTGHRFDLSLAAFRKLENPRVGVIAVTVTPL